MWKRAVWAEGKKQVEGVVPCTWVDEEINTIYWPQCLNAEKALKSRQAPDLKSWRKFNLIKIKLTSDCYEECDGQLTSAVEDTESQSDPEGDESVRKRKRKHTQKILPDDFISGQDLNLLQEESPAKLIMKERQSQAHHHAPVPPQKLCPASVQNVLRSPSPSQSSSSSRCSSLSTLVQPFSPLYGLEEHDSNYQENCHGSQDLHDRSGYQTDRRSSSNTPQTDRRPSSNTPKTDRRPSSNTPKTDSRSYSNTHKADRRSSSRTGKRNRSSSSSTSITDCRSYSGTDRDEHHSVFAMDENKFRKRILQLLLLIREDNKDMKEELRDIKTISGVSSFSDSGIDLRIPRRNHGRTSECRRGIGKCHLLSRDVK